MTTYRDIQLFQFGNRIVVVGDVYDEPSAKPCIVQGIHSRIERFSSFCNSDSFGSHLPVSSVHQQWASCFDAGMNTLTEQGTLSGGIKHGTWLRFSRQATIPNTLKLESTAYTQRQFVYAVCVAWSRWEGSARHGKAIRFGEAEFSLVCPTSRRRYPPSQVKTEKTYIRGELSGPYMETIGGTLVVLGQYADGQRSGIWEYYDLERRLVQKETYRDGMLDGPIRISISADQTISGVMRKNVRVGKFDWVNTSSGKTAFSYIYIDGQERYFIEYSPEGAPQEIGEFLNGQKHGEALAIKNSRATVASFYRAGECVLSGLGISHEFRRVVFRLAVKFNLAIYF